MAECARGGCVPGRHPVAMVDLASAVNQTLSQLARMLGPNFSVPPVGGRGDTVAA